MAVNTETHKWSRGRKSGADFLAPSIIAEEGAEGLQDPEAVHDYSKAVFLDQRSSCTDEPRVTMTE